VGYAVKGVLCYIVSMNVTDSSPSAIPERLGHKSKHLRTVVVVLVVLILVSASGYGAYYWQHNEVNRLNSQLAATKSQLSSVKSQDVSLYSQLSKRLASVEATNKQQSDQLAAIAAEVPVTQTSLDLVVNQSSRWSNIENPITSVYVSIDVSLTNNTKTPISVAATGFELKDSNNNAYIGETGYAEQKLGSGYTDLRDQTIQPGDSTTGAITFEVVDHSITSYTLENGTNKYPINATAWVH
jgi:hypothetical protein